MEDVVVYRIAPKLSDKELCVLASTSKRMQRMLSPICRQRLPGIHYSDKPMDIVNPYIVRINEVSISEYNRHWNTRYRDFSHMYIVHYVYLLLYATKPIPIDYIIQRGYYDIITEEVYQFWDFTLAAEVLVRGDPMLIRYVDIGILGLYYYVMGISSNLSTDYWYRIFVDFLVDIDHIYPVLHRIPSLKSILEDNAIQTYLGTALFEDIISPSNLSRYLHYIEYFGVISRYMVLSNIGYVMSKDDNIESPDIVREFIRKLLDIVDCNIYNIFKNVRNHRLIEIAIDVVMDYYHNDVNVIKTLLLTKNRMLISVLIHRYSEDVAVIAIDMVDVDDVEYIYILTDILLDKDRKYVRMLIDRLYDLDADDDIISYVYSVMYNGIHT